MRLRHGGWSKDEGVLAKYAEGERGRGGVFTDVRIPFFKVFTIKKTKR
jgi:hypothetical protein